MPAQDYMKAFDIAARKMVLSTYEGRSSETVWENTVRVTGLSYESWKLLTIARFWNPEERRQVKNALQEACGVALEAAGIPAGPQPGHFVACVIARLVHPSNWLVAASVAPQSYDVAAAIGSGDSEAVAVKTSRKQMEALVMAFGSGVYVEMPNLSQDDFELRENAHAAAMSVDPFEEE